MSSVSREVTENTHNIKPSSRLVKQRLWCFNQENAEPWANSYLGS
jgi:hypothetical protein